MKAAAVSILTTILAPLIIIFSVWVANAVTSNQSDISALKENKQNTQEILREIKNDVKLLLRK